jgi:hypothetical protein
MNFLSKIFEIDVCYITISIQHRKTYCDNDRMKYPTIAAAINKTNKYCTSDIILIKEKISDKMGHMYLLEI